MSEKKYKAICFDLDGTLLDTLEDIGNSMNDVLMSSGFAIHEIEAYKYFIGNGASKLVERALPEENRNEDTINECLGKFKNEYSLKWNVKTKPYDGIIDMLDNIVSLGVEIAVLSNKPHEFVGKCVIEYLSDYTFGAVFGLRDSVPRKPDPAGAFEIADILNIPVSEFIFAGDSSVDMKTAVAAGMFPVGVSWGFRPEKELIENGAEIVVRHPLEITDLFNS